MTTSTQWNKYFDDKILTGKCVSVYDGDTFKLELPVCCSSFIFSCRLLGIDTAEIRTRNVEEKIVAKEAKAYVAELLSTNAFTVKCHGTDKYGRVLCDILFPELDGSDLAELLIAKNYGYRYDGGTKESFEQWYKTSSGNKIEF